MKPSAEGKATIKFYMRFAVDQCKKVILENYKDDFLVIP
jgi:hypothetical protein